MKIKYFDISNLENNTCDIENNSLADYIYVGDPIKNENVKELITNNNSDKYVVFSNITKKGIQPYMDEGLLELLYLPIQNILMTASTDLNYVKKDLCVSIEEYLYMISESVAFLKGQNKKVIFLAKDFFKNFLIDNKLPIAVLQAAFMGGADALIMEDDEETSIENIENITKRMDDIFPTASLGIYAKGLNNIEKIKTAINNNITYVMSNINTIQKLKGTL